MARLPRILTMLAALAVAAPAEGQATAASGGAMRADEMERLRAQLEAAVDRVRARVVELQTSGEFQERHVRAFREAARRVELARPESPEYLAAIERLRAVAFEHQATIADDAQLKSAIKDMQRLQEQLVWRQPRLARRGYLGVSFTSENVVRGRTVYTRFEDYPQILTVEPESPAAQAGVRRGDVLVALDGRDLREREIAMGELLVPGRTVKVKVRREGRTMELPVRIRERPNAYRVFVRSGDAPGAASEYAYVTPDAPALAPPAPPVPPTPRAYPGPRAVERPLPSTTTVVSDGLDVSIQSGTLGSGLSFVRVALLGAELTQLDDDMRDVLGAERGVLVTRVQPTTPAAEAGLRGGDVLVRVGRRRVMDPRDVYEAVRQLNERGEKSAALELVRKGKDGKATLKW